MIHNASYDAHFIINQLAEKFKDELNCIGENMEKQLDTNSRFIDSFRFIPTSLSELTDNMSGNFNSIECK